MKKVTDVNYDKNYPHCCLLDIYLPETREKCPVFIYFHGGGLEVGSKSDVSDLENIVSKGIALVSADYRKYPEAKFPNFIEDAAKVVDFVFKYNDEHNVFSDIFIGGSSAGAYLSMMLYFDHNYLGKYMINPNEIKGWFFDAGQPTIHFNVLRERGLDTRLVRVDEAAPLFFVNKDVNMYNQSELIFIVSEHDIDGRVEQTHLMLNTMKQFKYDMSKVSYKFMNGYSHCAYPISDLVSNFVLKSLSK